MPGIEYLNVKAMSEEHARRVAMGIASVSYDRISHVSQTKKPRDAKTCKTNDVPTVGTRKWKTVYQVHAYGSKIALGLDRFEYIGMELVRDDIETKTEAVKVAREMAIKHQLPMTVQIVQKSVTHSPTAADVEPKTALGEYQVSYVTA